MQLRTDEVYIGNYSEFIPAIEIASEVASNMKKYDEAAILFYNASRIRKKLQYLYFKSEDYLYKNLEESFVNKLKNKKLNKLKHFKLKDSELLQLANVVIKS